MEQQIKCPDEVVDGSSITKEQRQTQFGRVAGGAGSCKPEKYQRSVIIEGTKLPCPKTNTRINSRTNQLVDIHQLYNKKDRFDYTENFDGCQTLKELKIFINLKCVVGQGGSQLRTLENVFHFIEAQLKVLKTSTDVYFANILDGDKAHESMFQLNYLLELPEYESVRRHVYIGDLRGYFDWFKQTIDWALAPK